MNISVKDIWLAPNLLSLFRLLLALPILIIFINYNNLEGANYYILLIIMVAFLSDLLDGFVARKLNCVSELGKIIDPIADKTLTAIIVISMWYYEYFSDIFLLIIVARDLLILVSGIIVSKKIGYVIPSDYIGKSTIFSIGLLIIFKLSFNNAPGIINNLLSAIVIILAIISLINYFIKGIKILKSNGNF